MLKKSASFVRAPIALLEHWVPAQRLNVRQRVRLVSSLAAALLDPFLNILQGLRTS